MICNKCGANIADGSVFCTSCGASLAAEPATSNPYESFDTNASPYGEPAPAPDYNVAMPKAKKGKGGLIAIIAAVVAVAIIAGVVIVAFFGGGFGTSLGGPLGDILSAAENNLEAGFMLKIDCTEKYNDEEEGKGTVELAVLGVDEETEKFAPELSAKYTDKDGEINALKYNTPVYSFSNNYIDDDEDKYEYGSLYENEYGMDRWVFEDIIDLVIKMDSDGIAEYLNSVYFGHKALDEKKFAKRMKELIKLLEDEEYLEENFGFSEKSGNGKTTYSFDIDLIEALELAIEFLEESSDMFIWETDYNDLIEELEDELEDFKEDNEEYNLNAEIVIEDDYITEFVVEYTEEIDRISQDGYGEESTVRINRFYKYEGEFSDFEAAEIDGDALDSFESYKAKLETAKGKYSEAEGIRWDEDGVYYYDENYNHVYLD